MPNIPTNPIPSGLPTKHNYLRKAATIPTDFNPCDIILDTSTHSIGSSLGQKYLFTYDIDTKSGDDYTQFFLVDDNNTYIEDYLQEADELIQKGADILTKVYSNDNNNITKSKYYNFSNLGRQKVIYFLDDENQIIFSKILDNGNVEILADDETKQLIPQISYNNYNNTKSNTNVIIDWSPLLLSDSNVSGAKWIIYAPDEILYNANKVVLYDTTKYLKNYLESLEGVSR